MTFSELAEYFEKLEKTSSRLSLIGILSALFKGIKAAEIEEVVYLIQGRIAPFYEPLEIGMSEQLVAQALARAFGLSKEEILKDYRRIGDLGLVALKLTQVKHQKTSLSISEVFATLKKIAQVNGEGTVEKKLNLLTDLIKQMGPVSAKHLIRIPLGNTRLGIGDPTVLDAMALAKLGDKSKRPILEEAYNKTSDLGLIGETLWKEGVSGVQKLTVHVGRPIRSQLAERLPDIKTILEKFKGEAHVQQKWDGFRTQLHKDGDHVRVFSRNLEETTPMFPEIVEAVKKQVKAKTAILDAEALAFNPESEEFLPFQETTKRRRKYNIEETAKRLPLKAFVFDAMYLNGKALIDLPLRERMEKLKAVLAGEQVLKTEGRKVLVEDQVLIAQPGEFTKSEKRITEVFNDAITKGLEGLVCKRPDSKYEAGARNFNWVKLKRHSAGELEDTIDCVILGYIFGRGKRATFGAGSLLVGIYDDKKDEFVTISKIGTGLTDEEWREIHKRADKIKVPHKPVRVNALLVPSVWIKPEIVIEVLADEITRSPIHTAGKTPSAPGYALRFPRMVKFREAEKRAEDATTVKELIEMYNQQSKKTN